MKKKIYVLDTNVLLVDARSFLKFKNNDIVIPYRVLEEIDKHKKRQDGVGLNARLTIRLLDEYRAKGNLHKGVRIAKGKGLLFIRGHAPELIPAGFSKEDPDNQIIATALTLKEEQPRRKVIVVSKDINMRVKCDALTLPCEDYEADQVITDASSLYSGFKTHLVDDQFIDQFYSGESFVLEKTDGKFYPNQFVMLVSSQNEKKTALSRFKEYGKPLEKIMDSKEPVWGLKARNKEQQFALDLLFDEDVPLVSIIGSSGCGKTLAAIAAGLQQVIEEQKYKKLVISRPVQPMGKDIGFLPGPQPLDAKIATPDGWTTMGELKVGDLVFGRDGIPAEVLKVFPKGEKEVYRVTTSDGTITECCLDHLWKTQTYSQFKHKKPGQVKTLSEILSTLERTDAKGKGKPNHYLPRNEAVLYKEQFLTIPAYSLGALLGDGSFSQNTSNGSLCLTVSDKEIANKVHHELLESLDCILKKDDKSIYYNIRRRVKKGNKPAKEVVLRDIEGREIKRFDSVGAASSELGVNKTTIGSRCKKNIVIEGIEFSFEPPKMRWTNPAKNELFKLNLLGVSHLNKFIPACYKYNTVENRLSLLQGLMDTDGTVKKSTGEAAFTTTSKQLALDLQEVVRSLGGRATIYERDRVGKESRTGNCKIVSRYISYEVTVNLPSDKYNPFSLPRKADFYRRSYMHQVKIVSVEKIGKKQVQCIEVDNEENLYLTDNFIVTHNSIEEKMRPWLMPIQDNIDFLMDGQKDAMGMFFDNGTIEIEAITYIRGRSINNAYIIIDEAQNLTAHELKTIVTRAGENAKIVLTGDIEQIDNMYIDSTTNGLSYAIEKFKEQELAGHVTLIRGERSKIATLAAKIL